MFTVSRFVWRHSTVSADADNLQRRFSKRTSERQSGFAAGRKNLLLQDYTAVFSVAILQREKLRRCSRNAISGTRANLLLLLLLGLRPVSNQLAHELLLTLR